MDAHAWMLPEPLNRSSEPYLLHGLVEISSLLRSLVRKRTRVAAYYGSGDAFLVTTVLGFDTHAWKLVLDAGRSPGDGPQAGSALTIVTAMDGVKVQFRVERAELRPWEALPAIWVRAPQTVLRLQRRENYRLRLPLLRPMLCRLPAAPGRSAMDLRVVDLSSVGLGLAMPSLRLRFVRGDRLPGCELRLPCGETLPVELEVRRVDEPGAPDTDEVPTCGCRFVDLPGTSATVIQRYINTVDREQRRRAV